MQIVSSSWQAIDVSLDEEDKCELKEKFANNASVSYVQVLYCM